MLNAFQILEENPTSLHATQNADFTFLGQ